MKKYNKMVVFERPVVIHDEDIVYGIAFNEKDFEEMIKGTAKNIESILQEYLEYVVGVSCFLDECPEDISDDGKWWYLGKMCSYKSTNVEDYCHRAFEQNPLRFEVVDLLSYKDEDLDGSTVIEKELWEAVKKNNNLFEEGLEDGQNR